MIAKHSWREDFHNPNGVVTYPEIGMKATCVQHYKCRHCGETLVLPDCKFKNAWCMQWFAAGCKGQPPKEKWKAPMRAKAPYEERKTYPAKRAKK